MLTRVIFFLKQRMQGVPWGILLTTYILISIGLFNLYSATNANINPHRFYDQLMWIGLGTIGMIFWGFVLDLKSIERYTIFGYVIICLMLLAVDIFGSHAKGAERWLVLGPIRLQPSEFAKFIIILIVARSFTFGRQLTEFSLKDLWLQAIFVGVPFVLILVQPDLGTASLVLLIASLQIVTVRISWRSLAVVAIAGISAAIFAWSFILYDYQKQRILNFLNPMLDPRGTGYHSIQSMIAVGSGGVWGQGFQQGTQAQFNFLPERHTDFIFAVWAEEHGFIGCLIIFSLYAIFILQIFQIAEKMRDTFASMVVMGVAAFFILHFLVNVSMALGVFPVVGVPLSLISYGGSHMLTTLSTIGLLIAAERKRISSLNFS